MTLTTVMTMGDNGGSEHDDSSDGDSYENHYPLRSQLVGRRAVPGHSAQFKDSNRPYACMGWLCKL